MVFKKATPVRRRERVVSDAVVFYAACDFSAPSSLAVVYDQAGVHFYIFFDIASAADLMARIYTKTAGAPCIVYTRNASLVALANYSKGLWCEHPSDADDVAACLESEKTRQDYTQIRRLVFG